MSGQFWRGFAEVLALMLDPTSESGSYGKEDQIMKNVKAYRMLEGRFSDQVKRFNSYPVNEADSDAQFWAVKDRLKLAAAALERSPEELKVTTLARSLGDIYRAVQRNLTPPELKEWNRLGEKLADLNDKYGA